MTKWMIPSDSGHSGRAETIERVSSMRTSLRRQCARIYHYILERITAIIGYIITFLHNLKDMLRSTIREPSIEDDINISVAVIGGI